MSEDGSAMTGDAPDRDACALASKLHAQGRAAEAEQAYHAVLRRQPDHYGALHGLGVLYMQTRRLEAAITTLRKAVAATEDSVTARNNLGVALSAAQRFVEAAEVYRDLLAREPDCLPALINLGKILSLLNNHSEAAPVLQQAVRLAPERADLHGLLAAALAATDHTEAALQHFERASVLAPDFALAHFNRGTALTYLGRKTEAAEAFARAVELEPDNPAFRRSMLGMDKITAGNPDLAALEKMASAKRLDPSEAIAVPFALAKAYEDMSEAARAFAEWRKGNAAKRRVSRYNLQNDLDRFHAIAATFTAEFITAHADQGYTSEVPVFVIGMPRSGTTLVEQILASHPSVFGAGEQGILPRFINAGRAGRGFPAQVKNLEAAAWNALGADYVQALTALAPQARRIIDKLPLNFQLAGLIHLALPQARIIHIARDPLDTCFSCYSSL
ncbi:MAG: sulfotransferase, partial [Rhizomicrobium sp.]|nr:sulfotransferase [Rhizomicrobium sp.]